MPPPQQQQQQQQPRRPFTTSSLTNSIKSTIANQPLLSNLTSIDKLSSQASNLAQKAPFFSQINQQFQQHHNNQSSVDDASARSSSAPTSNGAQNNNNNNSILNRVGAGIGTSALINNTSSNPNNDTNTMFRSNNNNNSHQQQPPPAKLPPASTPAVDMSHLTEEERLMIESVMAKAQMADMGIPVDTSTPSSTNLPSMASQVLSEQTRQQQQLAKQQLQQQQQQQQQLQQQQLQQQQLQMQQQQLQQQQQNQQPVNTLQQQLQYPNQANLIQQQHQPPLSQQQPFNMMQQHQTQQQEHPVNQIQQKQPPQHQQQQQQQPINLMQQYQSQSQPQQQPPNLLQQQQHQQHNQQQQPSVSMPQQQQQQLQQQQPVVNMPQQHQQPQQLPVNILQQQQSQQDIGSQQLNNSVNNNNNMQPQDFSAYGQQSINSYPTAQQVAPNRQQNSANNMQLQDYSMYGQQPLDSYPISQANQLQQQPDQRLQTTPGNLMYDQQQQQQQYDYNLQQQPNAFVVNSEQPQQVIVVDGNDSFGRTGDIRFAQQQNGPPQLDRPSNHRVAYHELLDKDYERAYSDQEYGNHHQATPDGIVRRGEYNQIGRKHRPDDTGAIDGHMAPASPRARNQQNMIKKGRQDVGMTRGDTLTGARRNRQLATGGLGPAAGSDRRNIQAYDLAAPRHGNSPSAGALKPRVPRQLPKQPVAPTPAAMQDQGASVRNNKTSGIRRQQSSGSGGATIIKQQQQQQLRPSSASGNKSQQQASRRKLVATSSLSNNSNTSNNSNKRRQQSTGSSRDYPTDSENYLSHEDEDDEDEEVDTSLVTYEDEEDEDELDADEDDEEIGNVTNDQRLSANQRLKRRQKTAKQQQANNNQSKDDTNTAAQQQQDADDDNQVAPKLLIEKSEKALKLLGELKLTEQANQVMEQQQLLIKQSQELIKLQQAQLEKQQENKEQQKQQHLSAKVAEIDQDEASKQSESNVEMLTGQQTAKADRSDLEMQTDDDDQANASAKTKTTKTRDDSNNYASEKSIGCANDNSTGAKGNKQTAGTSSSGRFAALDHVDSDSSEQFVMSSRKSAIIKTTDHQKQKTSAMSDNAPKLKATSNNNNNNNILQSPTDTTDSDIDLSISIHSTGVGSHNQHQSSRSNRPSRHQHHATTSAANNRTSATGSSGPQQTHHNTRTGSLARRREPTGLPPSPLPVAAAIQLHQMQQQHFKNQFAACGRLAANVAASKSAASYANLRSRSVTSSPSSYLYDLRQGLATTAPSGQAPSASGYLTDTGAGGGHNSRLFGLNYRRPGSPDTLSEYGGQRRRKRLPEPPQNAVPITPSMVRKMIQAQKAAAASAAASASLGGSAAAVAGTGSGSLATTTTSNKLLSSLNNTPASASHRLANSMAFGGAGSTRSAVTSALVGTGSDSLGASHPAAAAALNYNQANQYHHHQSGASNISPSQHQYQHQHHQQQQSQQQRGSELNKFLTSTYGNSILKTSGAGPNAVTPTSHTTTGAGVNLANVDDTPELDKLISNLDEYYGLSSSDRPSAGGIGAKRQVRLAPFATTSAAASDYSAANQQHLLYGTTRQPATSYTGSLIRRNSEGGTSEMVPSALSNATSFNRQQQQRPLFNRQQTSRDTHSYSPLATGSSSHIPTTAYSTTHARQYPISTLNDVITGASASAFDTRDAQPVFGGGRHLTGDRLSPYSQLPSSLTKQPMNYAANAISRPSTGYVAPSSYLNYASAGDNNNSIRSASLQQRYDDLNNARRVNLDSYGTSMSASEGINYQMQPNTSASSRYHPMSSDNYGQTSGLMSRYYPNEYPSSLASSNPVNRRSHLLTNNGSHRSMDLDTRYSSAPGATSLNSYERPTSTSMGISQPSSNINLYQHHQQIHNNTNNPMDSYYQQYHSQQQQQHYPPHINNRQQQQQLQSTSSSNHPNNTSSGSLFAPFTKDDIIRNGPKFNSIGYRFRTENQNKYVPDARLSSDCLQTKYMHPYKRILLSKNPKDRIGNGIGVRIIGGQPMPNVYDKVNKCIITSGAFVIQVFQSSNVYLMDELHEGDQIIEWNGVNLCNRSDQEVQQILLSQFTDDEVEIVYLNRDKFNEVYRSQEMQSNDLNRIGLQRLPSQQQQQQFDEYFVNDDQNDLFDTYSKLHKSSQFHTANNPATSQHHHASDMGKGSFRRKLSLSSISHIWSK